MSSSPGDILCLNVGSSSVKTATFENASPFREIDRSLVEATTNHADIITSLDVPSPVAVAHRVVHGGDNHRPMIITEAVVDDLKSLSKLAPLHMPPAIAAIEASLKRWPNSVQVACFDTAFHHSMPERNRRFPIANELLQSGIRRYGFHGLNCEHVVATVAPDKLQRAVIAHLGSGCSITAVANGKSLNTTMGFTPLAGILMGTRPGDLDAGLVLHLLNSGHSADEMATLLNKKSGLLAVGGTNDMRELVQRAGADDPNAILAVEMFCQRIANQIGAYAVELGGLETLIFTGGIGEHAAVIRDTIVGQANVLGEFETLVVPANEELVLARHAAHAIGVSG